MSPLLKKILAVIAALGVLAVLIAVLPLQAWLLHVVEWARGAGLAGAVAYGAVYVLATVLALPGSILTLGAGFVWGVVLGTLLVSPASIIGATCAFVLGRTLLRRRIEGRVRASPRVAAIDEAVARNGFKVVLLLRLSPILPFNVLNYGLGLTRVRLRDYVLGSALGMLPATILYVWIGSLVTTAAELGARSASGNGRGAKLALFGLGLVATAVAVALIARAARRVLGKELGPEAVVASTPAPEGDGA